MSKSKRRVQASKRRTPDLSALKPQVTIPETCSTGIKPLPYSVARAITRYNNGVRIEECSVCDWYHVRKEEQ